MSKVHVRYTRYRQTNQYTYRVYSTRSISADHSRAPLHATLDMLLYLLTYYQATPAFVQYILPFGKQLHAHFFHAMGFCSSSTIQPQRSGLYLPQIGRCGRNIEFCYSLKGVERTFGENTPWKIRHCSIFHHFDLETKSSAWIIINANNVIEHAVDKYCTKSKATRTSAQGLGATLAIHSLVLEWADNNWSSYINHLMEVLVNETESTHLALLCPNASPQRDSWSSSSDSDRGMSRNKILSIVSHFWKRLSQRFDASWFGAKKSLSPPIDDDNSLELQNRGEDIPKCAEEPIPTSALPEVLLVGQEASQALLVLKAAASVVTALRQEYEVLLSGNYSAGVSSEELTTVKEFCCHVADLERDFAMHQNSVESLLREVESRKIMVRPSPFPINHSQNSLRSRYTTFSNAEICSTWRV
jgi:hypothetical protein